MQYDTTVNRWHTSRTRPINASNPCSEYMFLDDSPASWPADLLKFAPTALRRRSLPSGCRHHHYRAGNPGRQRGYRPRSSEELARYRPLAWATRTSALLLMAAGLPYDSDAGRDYAACVTAIMCGKPISSPPRSPNNASHSAHHRHLQARLGVTTAKPCPSRLPRLVHQPRAVPRRDPHAPRQRQQHQQNNVPASI